MKKHIALIIAVVLMLNLCPISLAGVFDSVIDVSAAKKDKPVLIYMAEDYETQVIGDNANGIWNYGTWAAGLTKGAVYPKPDHPENIAFEYSSSSGSTVCENLIPLYYAPIYTDFVFDFTFHVGSAGQIGVAISRDADKPNKYLEAGTKTGEILTLSSSVVLNNVTVKTGLSTNEWHRFQMKVNMKTKRADVYVDGELASKDVSFPITQNLAAIRFIAPTARGQETTKYYIDDINLYLSDRILTDEELSSDIAEYTASGLRPHARYLAGFASHYYQFVFDMFYDEFVMTTGGKRIWKDNKFYSLPINLISEGEKILVPLRAFSEMMGATVDYIDGVIIVSINGKTMKLIVDSETYYIDGRASKLYTPVRTVKDYAVIDLDVICNFFGIGYKRFENLTTSAKYSYDIISFSGDLDCDYDVCGIPGQASEEGGTRTMYVECLIRMTEMLCIDLPSQDDVKRIMSERFEEGQHPRFLINDFQKIKDDLNRGDEEFNKTVQNFIDQATANLNNNTFNEKVVNVEELYRKMLMMSFAWNMTGEQKYLDFITRKIDELYVFLKEAWPAWKVGNQALNHGNAAIGYGITYDWMYNTLKEKDPERLEKLREIVSTMGFFQHDEVFRSGIQNYQTSAEYEYGNQSVFKNTGSIACAVALYDEYPEVASALISANLRAIVNPFRDFAPSGGWAEGMSYWSYTVDTMPLTIDAIEAVFGTHFGLYDLPGVAHTTDYPISTLGSSGVPYSVGDSDASSPWASLYTKEAKYNNDIGKAMLYRQHRPNVTITDILNWVFLTPEQIANATSAGISNDIHMEKLEDCILKTGTNFSDTSIFMHGGGVSDAHGHEDNGTFMFDMLGYRWANDIGIEHYRLIEFGNFEGRTAADPNRPYTGYLFHDYYRDNAEGHNTVFADLGGPYTGRYHMARDGRSKFVKKEFSNSLSYALLDMTSTNPIFTSAIRGMKLDKIQNEIVIHDRFQAREKTDFHWAMHTEADIEVAEDGRSAILSTDNGSKRIWMGIISDDDYIIKDMAPFPYEGPLKATDIAPGEIMRPSGYENTMIRPPAESPVDKPFTQWGFATAVKKGFRRLTIETTEDTDDFNLMVAFKPLLPGQTEPSIMPVVTPMEKWSTKNAVKAANAQEILIDGEPLKGLAEGVYNYTCEVFTNEVPVPKVEVKAHEKYSVEVIPATELPGITAITLKEGDKVAAIYYITFKPLNDLRLFRSDKQLPLVSYEVAAGYDTATDPANLFDNDTTTRFATDVQGGYVIIDLGSEKEVEKVMMSFNNGNVRKENVKIEYSSDKTNWKLGFEGQSSGTTMDLQPFAFASPTNMRYIKVSFYGNTKSLWASATEIWAYSK